MALNARQKQALIRKVGARIDSIRRHNGPPCIQVHALQVWGPVRAVHPLASPWLITLIDAVCVAGKVDPEA